jgi:hypothetical protein
VSADLVSQLEPRLESLMPPKITPLVASSFAFVAFALAIVVGLSKGNPADAILWRSLVVLMFGFIGGSIVGKVCDYLVSVASRKIEAAAEAALAAEELSREGQFEPQAQ